MKYSAIVVAALAAVVSAAGLSELPTCALPCITDALGSTPCGSNIACACADPKFTGTSATCIQAKCNPQDQQKAVSAAAAICKSAGVDISTVLPGAPSSSPAPSAPPTPTGYSTSSWATATRSGVPPNKTTSLPPYPTVGGSNNTNGSTVPVPTISGNVNPNGAGRIAAAGSAVGLGLAALFFAL